MSTNSIHIYVYIYITVFTISMKSSAGQCDNTPTRCLELLCKENSTGFAIFMCVVDTYV